MFVKSKCPLCQVYTNKWFMRYLRHLLLRFGYRLQNLSLSVNSDFRVLITRNLMDIITELAPNIEQLNFSGNVIYVGAIEALKVGKKSCSLYLNIYFSRNWKNISKKIDFL